MAAAFSSTQSNAVDIRDVIKCVICKGERSSLLIQLGCFHLCHKTCIRNARPGSQITCAGCKTKTMVPEEGVDGLSDEPLQYKMKEIAEILSNTSPPCKLCEFSDEFNTSTHFCVTCKYHLCPGDRRRHKAFPDHKVITNDEIQTDEYLPQILTSKDAVCTIHSSASNKEMIKFFCEDCKIPVCQVCNGTDHKPHKTISIQQASHRLKEELKSKAMDITPMMVNCEMAVDKLERLLNEVDHESRQNIDKCKKWGEDIKQTVDKIVNKNIQTIENMAQSQKNEIKKVKNEEYHQNQRFQGGKDYIEVFLKFGSESDFLKKYTKFMENLKNCLQQKTRGQITVRKSKVGRKDVKEIEKCLQEMLKVETVNENDQISSPLTIRPSPPQQRPQIQQQQQLTSCSVEKKWLTRGRTGIAFDGEDIIAVGGKNIDVYGMDGENKGSIRCQKLGDAWNVAVVHNQLFISDKDEQKILVTDRNGRLQRIFNLPNDILFYRTLSLAVDHTHNNIYIGSTITNTIYKCSVRDTQGQPYITGVSSSAYLCVTHNSELIVSNEYSSTVHKYNKDGTLMWKYGRQGSGEDELNKPQGVCVDHLGQVFICDYNHHRIKLLSAEGKLLSILNIGEKIVYPQAIVFNNRKIIISNKDHIFVITCNYM